MSEWEDKVAAFWLARSIEEDKRVLARLEHDDALALKAGRCCCAAPGCHEDGCDGTGRELAARVAAASVRS